jgi:hypothetical protein
MILNDLRIGQEIGELVVARFDLLDFILHTDGSVLLLLLRLVEVVSVFSPEQLRFARGGGQSLLPGVEGMAGTAYFHPDVLFGGTRLEAVAACAGNRCFVIFRMDILFHCPLLLFIH